MIDATSLPRDVRYVSQPASTAALLGLAIAKSVLPDEALSRLKMKDLFEYRTSAKDAYGAWSIEVDRLAQKLLDIPADRFGAEAAKLIVTDVRPRMLELRLEMATARDKLFGDLVKTVSKWGGANDLIGLPREPESSHCDRCIRRSACARSR